MIKIHKKLGNLAILIVIIAIIIPGQSLAFLGFDLSQNVGSLSALAFIGSDYSPWNKTVEISDPDLVLDFVSDNFIVASNISTVPQKTNVARKVVWVTATGYSSTKNQTDSTPFITASGTHVRDGVIAANFLPIGTVIKIPEVFGNKTFVVEDRMNQRYQNRIDVWFPEIESAREFGLKKVKIEIVS